MSDALVSFYRGLFNVARTAEWLAPGRDSLAEAVWDLRLLTAIGQIRDVIRPSDITELLENYATALVGLPERVDRLLDYAGAGLSLSKGGKDVERRQHSAENRYVRIVCLLLALATILLLLHWTSVSMGSSWNAVVAVSFFALVMYVLSTGIR
jgi:hypothetical protein